MTYETAPVVGGSEGANKAVGCVAPLHKAQKPSASASLSPFLLSLAQSSSSVRCQPGGSISSGSRPTVKRQKLDENINPMAPGTSAAAIAIDDGADDDGEDDDNINILVDKGNDNDDDGDEVAIANVDTHGSVNVSALHPTNAADSSGFGLFVLLDLNNSAVADVKGWSCKKFLNNLRADYYSKDMMWIRCLHLQLPQEPRSKHNVNDMMGFMLLEWQTNRYMQQCIFSMAGICNRIEGKFSDEFKNINERTRISKKF